MSDSVTATPNVRTISKAELTKAIADNNDWFVSAVTATCLHISANDAAYADNEGASQVKLVYALAKQKREVSGNLRAEALKFMSQQKIVDMLWENIKTKYGPKSE